MTTASQLRRLLLTLHIVTSVGWFGAAAAFAGLVVAALRSADAPQLRAAYLVMEPITRYAIIPLALASLLTGIVQGLITPWGLMRHYWVIYKLALTLVATTILLINLETVTALGQHALAGQDAGLVGLKAQLIHATLGMLALLLIAVLGIYKPKGMTRYGWRKQHERAAAEA